MLRRTTVALAIVLAIADCSTSAQEAARAPLGEHFGSFLEDSDGEYDFLWRRLLLAETVVEASVCVTLLKETIEMWWDPGREADAPYPIREIEVEFDDVIVLKASNRPDLSPIRWVLRADLAGELEAMATNGRVLFLFAKGRTGWSLDWDARPAFLPFAPSTTATLSRIRSVLGQAGEFRRLEALGLESIRSVDDTSEVWHGVADLVAGLDQPSAAGQKASLDLLAAEGSAAILPLVAMLDRTTGPDVRQPLLIDTLEDVVGPVAFRPRSREERLDYILRNLTGGVLFHVYDREGRWDRKLALQEWRALAGEVASSLRTNP